MTLYYMPCYIINKYEFATFHNILSRAMDSNHFPNFLCQYIWHRMGSHSNCQIPTGKCDHSKVPALLLVGRILSSADYPYSHSLHRKCQLSAEPSNHTTCLFENQGVSKLHFTPTLFDSCLNCEYRITKYAFGKRQEREAT